MDPFREPLSSILLGFCHLLSTLFLSKIVHPLTAILSIAPHPTPVAAPQGNGFIPGPLAYTVSPEFPTSAFSSYYVKAAPTQEPQPAVYDPILNITFPYNLTDPDIIPSVGSDPVSFPEPLVNISFPAADILFHSAYSNISAIIGNDSIASNCSKCLAALSIGKAVAQAIPDRIPDLLIRLCSRFELYPDAKCVNKYAARSYGATWAQVLAFANVSDLDGHYICNDIKTWICPSPTISPFNVSRLFPKPRPLNATIPKASGNRVKVLHLSDFHLDPRYSVASEANCSTGFCCRTNIPPANSSIDHVLIPAPLYGAYKCDTPYYLALAALQAIPPLTGTSHNKSDIAWTIYTGDLVSHDSQNQLSRAYLEYTETSVFALFKKYIGGPVFAVLGNHDSNPNGIDAPHSLPGTLGEKFSWNYNHISSLWEQEGWIDSSAANKARLHYGAYSIRNHLGLRIITLNTDFWLKSNPFNYINSTNPDVSGTLRFLIQELQAAEDANDRVWILGHVPSGWDGNNALKNPADLFHLIIDRYSPHVIANIFFGHTVCFPNPLSSLLTSLQASRPNHNLLPL